jgi:N-acetylmuramoyl-L-alanine amidase
MYAIKQDYISFGNSRSGSSISGPSFIVAHDTGNPGSTAHGNRNWFDRAQPSASAHTFIDDNYILEMIPLNEKAWHVQYQKTKDNQMFGADSNDAAIGVELCWGGSIDFWVAYRCYVWYHAYLCHKFGLKPRDHIVAHSTLDPGRRSDPENALNRYGISWYEFIDDVQKAYENKGRLTKGEVIVMLLENGDAGPQVKKLQQDLMKAGEKLPRYGADGKFGQETLDAVKAFQARHDLAVDGLAGPKTLGKLKEVLSGGETDTFTLGGKTFEVKEVK